MNYRETHSNSVYLHKKLYMISKDGAKYTKRNKNMSTKIDNSSQHVGALYTHKGSLHTTIREQLIIQLIRTSKLRLPNGAFVINSRFNSQN